MTGWRDGQVRSHDADTGQLLWSIDNAHAHGVTSLIVSHNERFLVTGGMEGELRVWELRSRELVRTTQFGVPGGYSYFMFDACREQAGNVSASNLACYPLVFAVCFHNTGLRSQNALRNRTVMVDCFATQVSHLKQHGQRVTSLALFSDDVHALSVSRDRSLICWDLRSESQVNFRHRRNEMCRKGGLSLCGEHLHFPDCFMEVSVALRVRTWRIGVS